MTEPANATRTSERPRHAGDRSLGCHAGREMAGPLLPATRARLRDRAVGCVIAVVVLLLAGCVAAPADRRAKTDQLTQQMRTLPGVVTASSDLVNSPAQGVVNFQLDVAVADDVTGDQLAAITSRYLDHLRAVDYTGYQTELDVHRDWNQFAVDSGDRAVTNADQIIEQARNWVALRHEFPGATVRFRATITHAATAAGQNSGHPNAGTIELPEAADYTAVAATVSTLATRFPQLSAGNWAISAGKAHPADITTARRLPTTDEINIWNRVNADQSVPHVDAMTINGPTTGPLWISEKTQSRDITVAMQLAQAHLPIMATLPAPVLYTANDQLQGHLGYAGQATGSLAITVGGCMQRTYRPDATEQALIDRYQRCPR
jgi:outer membrane murein-binding lipoprotein Lpp